MQEIEKKERKDLLKEEATERARIQLMQEGNLQNVCRKNHVVLVKN